MPTAVPSDVIKMIDQTLPVAGRQTSEAIRLGPEYSPFLIGVCELASAVPSQLLQLTGEDYSDLIVGIAVLKYMTGLWTSRGEVDVPQKVRGVHPIVLVRRSLAKCPDEAPAPATASLKFITDAKLRESIRLDISAANQSLHNANWKGATVLAGSAAEALLLWSVQEKKNAAEVDAARTTLIGRKEFSAKQSPDPEYWSLGEYIGIATELKLIGAETRKQSEIAQGFRNLIHPGKAARLGKACDRGTALSALAAVEHIVRD